MFEAVIARKQIYSVEESAGDFLADPRSHLAPTAVIRRQTRLRACL